jgi:glycosyltransferase involved in cell wall biosynthesis
MESNYGTRRKIRMCHVVRHARIAGTEKHVYLLATGLDRKRFDVHVCAFENGKLVQRLRAKGVTVTVIPKSHSAIHFAKLAKFFCREKYDLVHCHSGGYACLAARVGGIRRIVYTKHGIGFTPEELRDRSSFRRLRDRVVDLCVIKYIALTRYDKEVMINVLGIAAGKIEIIPNGIDPGLVFASGTVRVRRQNLVGTVGRLTRQKGIEYLIRAMPMIISKHRDAKLLIAGSGEEEFRLKNLVQQLKLEKRVEFMGYLDDPISMMRNLNVFVLPSVWEGFPYVLLEAMALKKPIVATDIFGVNEIVEHENSGMLVQPKDPDGIAEATVMLLSDKVMSRRMGEAAYKQVLADFTLEGSILQTMKLYTQFFVGVTGSR